VIGDLLAGDYSTPLGVTLGQTLGTVAAILLAAVLLIRMGARRPGLRVRDVLVLIVCAAGATAVGAAIGVLAIWIAGDLPAIGAQRVWRTWWLSDLAGALVVAPAALTWATARGRR
jgi:integral membrane sensor domain MASE1